MFESSVSIVCSPFCTVKEILKTALSQRLLRDFTDKQVLGKRKPLTALLIIVNIITNDNDYHYHCIPLKSGDFFRHRTENYYQLHTGR